MPFSSLFEQGRGRKGDEGDGIGWRKGVLVASLQGTRDFVLIRSAIIIQNSDKCCFGSCVWIEVAGPFLQILDTNFRMQFNMATSKCNPINQ